MNAKYKVLSADDELWSRENIRRMLSWEDYSIDFLEPACDGEEVLEVLPDRRNGRCLQYHQECKHHCGQTLNRYTILHTHTPSKSEKQTWG